MFPVRIAKRSTHSIAKFNPQKHLIPCTNSFVDVNNIKVHSLSSLGYNNVDFDNDGIIDFGYAEPFKLLTPECIDIIRSELLSSDVTENCYYSSDIAPLVIRRPSTYSHFLYDLINCDEMVNIVSTITNTKLKPHPMDFEKSHCNIQSQHKQELIEDYNIFDWHYDSQDFVLIIMLSDVPSDAIGGATMVEYHDMDKNEKLCKELMFDGAGTAYLMQSNQIYHAANNAKNYVRITMTSSYVYDNFENHDPSTIEIARYYTDHKELVNEYLDYRLNDLINKTKYYTQKYDQQMNIENDYNYKFMVDDFKTLQKDINVVIKSIELVRDCDDENRPKKLKPHEIDMSFARNWKTKHYS